MRLHIQRKQILQNLPQIHTQKRKSVLKGYQKDRNYSSQIIPQIRDSYETPIEQPKFDEVIYQDVKKYLQIYDQAQAKFYTQWKMLEYDGGHFSEHIDAQEENQKYYQVATQILLPPKKLCNYQGGILKIKQNDQVIEISPDLNLWTHIILPIGLLHQVTQVIGKRISFVRLLFVEKKKGRIYEKQLKNTDDTIVAVVQN